MSFIRMKVNKFIKIENQNKSHLNQNDIKIMENDEEDELSDAHDINRKSSYFVLLQKSLPESLL